eukprot:2152083-Rhodomonas_salina.2
MRRGKPHQTRGRLSEGGRRNCGGRRGGGGGGEGGAEVSCRQQRLLVHQPACVERELRRRNIGERRNNGRR